MLIKHYVDSGEESRSIRVCEVECVDFSVEDFSYSNNNVLQRATRVRATIYDPESSWMLSLDQSWTMDEVELYLNAMLRGAYLIDLTIFQEPFDG